MLLHDHSEGWRLARELPRRIAVVDPRRVLERADCRNDLRADDLRT